MRCHSKTLLFCLTLVLALSPALADDPLETHGTWQTAPDILSQFDDTDLWSTRTTPFAALQQGVTVVTTVAGKPAQGTQWSQHPAYPTIHTTHVRADWTGNAVLKMNVFSALATHERITVAVLSDNPQTRGRDWFHMTFSVDWRGWRVLQFPLSTFAEIGEPSGWGSISGLYLCTMMFGYQPHPSTDIVIGRLALGERMTGEPVAPIPSQPVPEAGEFRTQTTAPTLDLQRLNHTYPEASQLGALALPITYKPYFLAERALLSYFPRFTPGAVSFDPRGNAIVFGGAHALQQCSRDGLWSYTDILAPVVVPYARDTLGFQAVSFENGNQSNETAIRFDADGDVYAMAYVSDPTGNWRTRTALLLHSRDDMVTWDVHKLPYYMARFETFTGHNRDCLNYPPAILLSRYHAPTETYLLTPSKRPDGTLVLPEMIRLAEKAVCVLTHSGEAAQLVSIGDDIVIVYGKLEVLPGKTEADGVPAYVVRYNRKSGRLSEPRLLGFGGKNARDGHNWPALTVDSKGTFHVLINGHHDWLVYTHSLAPNRIDEWSEPVRFAAGVSYAGLVCGPDDTLYTVTRCSDPGYYFRLTLHRKRPGQDWEEPRHLVCPYKPYYHVWRHKLSIQPHTGRLFLFYWSQTPNMCLFMDELSFFLYRKPDLESLCLGDGETPKLPTGTYKSTPRKYAFYGVPPSEPTLLVSPDGGDTWHLGATPDFLPVKGN